MLQVLLRLCGFSAFIALVAVVVFMVCGFCGSWLLRVLGLFWFLGFCGFVAFVFFSLSEFMCMFARGIDRCFQQKFIVQLFLLDLCFTTNNRGKKGLASSYDWAVHKNLSPNRDP